MNFDWEQYIENYADLKAAGINTQQKALQHYNRYGKRENRIDKIVNFNFIISGEKIQLKCDYFIGSIDDINNNPIVKHEIKKNPKKWLQKSSDVIKESKIFCYGHLLGTDSLIILLRDIIYPFDIYFHNSDSAFLEVHYNQLKEISNLKQIYAQNNTVKEVITLPIGQANTMWKHGNSKILLSKINENVQKTKEIFLNFSITTPKRNGLRNTLYFIPWVENKEYEDYINTLAEYRYCICVEGNGLDTHRFWECIYLKVIPICVKNEWTEIVKEKFPMIIIDSWESLKDIKLTYNVEWEKYKNIFMDYYI